MQKNIVSRQQLTLTTDHKIGKLNMNYLDEKKETNNIITSSNESFGVLPDQGLHFYCVNEELFILYILHLFD